MRFLLIYTCLHLIIPKTMLSVYVNNRDLLCKNKESSASGKNRIMQREQTKKKDSFKGEFNPAKNRNTRDPSSSVQKLFTSDDQYCEINIDAQISLLFFFKYHIVYITFLDIFYIYSAFKQFWGIISVSQDNQLIEIWKKLKYWSKFAIQISRQKANSRAT